MRRVRAAFLALGLLPLAAAHAQDAARSVPSPADAGEVVEQGPPPPLPDLSDPNSRAGEALNEPGSRSGIPKALRSSGSRAGGPANELNPGGMVEAPAPPKGDVAKVVAGQELFHGNYCGKGQRGEGLPPTDALDAACMRHDACYAAAGRPSCGCDDTLRREATSVADGEGATLEVRRRAVSVAEAASAMRCERP